MNTYKIIFDGKESKNNIEIFTGTHATLIAHVLKLIEQGFTNVQAVTITTGGNNND